jgi:hypothetical protein
MSSEQFGFLLLGAFILYLVLQDRAADAKSTSMRTKIQPIGVQPKLTDEKIIRREKQFEQHFGSNLPDVPSTRELYIYQSMMRPWFHELSAFHRYDDERVGKLRDDRSDAQLADRKATIIEDAFAVSVGDLAVQELSQVRKLERSDFEVRESIVVRLKSISG